MRWAGVAWSVLLLGAGLSCGGRYSSGGASDDEGRGGSASSSGGKPGKAPGGSSSVPSIPPIGTAGTSSSAGAPVTGTAGTASASASGGACSTGPIGCPVGFIAAVDGNGCFRECVPGECVGVFCNPEPCDSGQHLELLSDECCPTCVGDTKLTCEEALAEYQRLRLKVLLESSRPYCHEGGECALFWESNRCATTCGSPIRADARDFAEEELGNFAAAYCGACPKPEPTACPEPPAYGCVDGSCDFF